MPDVDIDFFDRDGVLKLFKHTPATIIKENKIEKHKTGVYFHAVPEHPVTGHSTIDYKEAEDRGYFKIDCLNVSIYKNIKSEQELVELMIQEPDWNMLKHQEIVDQLFHLNGPLLITAKPTLGQARLGPDTRHKPASASRHRPARPRKTA